MLSEKKISVRYKAFLLILVSVTVLFSSFVSNADEYQLSGSSLYARSAILMDAQNGRVLFEKNAYEKMPNASTTKILTCILALESGKLNDVVTVSKNAQSQPKVKMNLVEGDEFILSDLLYSLMLESHNDTAVAIAEAVAGDTQQFSEMMNRKAEEIGCLNTCFLTPNGLDATVEGREHGTTAYDLALISAYAIQNETFLEIINTREKEICNVSKTRHYYLNNANAFLNSYEGAIGIKTGYTSKAGYCFVGAVRQNGGTFISVCLGSGWPPNKNYKWEDTNKLMSFGKVKYELCQYTETVLEIPTEVENGIQEEVLLYPAKTQFNFLKAENEEVSFWDEISGVPVAPIEAGEVVGVRHYEIDGVEIGSTNLLVKEGIKERTYSFYLDYVYGVFLFGY